MIEDTKRTERVTKRTPIVTEVPYGYIMAQVIKIFVDRRRSRRRGGLLSWDKRPLFCIIGSLFGKHLGQHLGQKHILGKNIEPDRGLCYNLIKIALLFALLIC
jgi:hypothetical protein